MTTTKQWTTSQNHNIPFDSILYTVMTSSTANNNNASLYEYTYDRIVLGSLTSLLSITCLFLIVHHFYNRHNPWSFHPWFLLLSFCWMLLRSVFWFAPIYNCSVLFLFYIPICVQFFVFGLLLVWILFVIYDAASKKNHETLHIWQVEAMKMSSKSMDITQSSSTSCFTWMKKRLFHIGVLLVYAVVNISVLGLVIAYCSITCKLNQMRPMWANVMSIVTGAGFSCLGLLLILFGSILFILQRRKKSTAATTPTTASLRLNQTDQPNLMLRLHAPLILPLTILNTILFLSRTIIDILSLIPTIPFNNELGHLRQSDLGKFIIMTCFVFWEIIPICSVLWLLGRGTGGTRITNRGDAFLRNRMSNPNTSNYYQQTYLPHNYQRFSGSSDYNAYDYEDYDSDVNSNSELTEGSTSDLSHTPSQSSNYLER